MPAHTTHTHSHTPHTHTHAHTQKPAFVPRTASDELSELLQACNEEATLDLFSAEGSMNVTAAMVRACQGEEAMEGVLHAASNGGGYQLAP